MAIANIKEFLGTIEEEFDIAIEDASKKLTSAIARDMWRFLTRDSRTVGFQFGSPVLSGQYYVNHKVSLNNIDTSFTLINKQGFVEGDKPLPPLPLGEVEKVLKNWKRGDTINFSNSLPYADLIEAGLSRFKAPEGVYAVAINAVKMKYSSEQQVLAVTSGRGKF